MHMDTNTILERAKQLINDEAQDLNRLADSLDNNFSKAVELILKTKGRVIVIGIGKSGHIGAKIAATLASTGSPSFFTHPSELTHGDLGMITHEDICIIISNSGETSEVVNIIPHLTNRNIPIIGVSSKPKSTLATLSNVYLNLQVTKEAGFLNLAPTSSTTATLALGDALAICAMEAKSFSKEDFVEFHPGGSLGKRLIKVYDLMISEKSDIPIVSTQQSYAELLVTISDKGLGMTCVAEGDQLLNIVTDGDIRRLQLKHKEDIYTMKINDCIKDKSTPKTINTEERAFKALEIMRECKISSLVVTNEKNDIQGILTLQAILAAGIA